MVQLGSSPLNIQFSGVPNKNTYAVSHSDSLASFSVIFIVISETMQMYLKQRYFRFFGVSFILNDWLEISRSRLHQSWYCYTMVRTCFRGSILFLFRLCFYESNSIKLLLPLKYVLPKK